MFVGTIKPCLNHCVATIGGKGHSASGIGTVYWTWNDDNGMKHNYLVKDVLYFPQLPVNILIITTLVEQFGDSGGTSINTK